jgi:hypothetical protein
MGLGNRGSPVPSTAHTPRNTVYLGLLVMEKVGRVVGCNSGGNPCQVPGPIVIAAVRGPLRVGNGDPVRACAVQADQFGRF